MDSYKETENNLETLKGIIELSTDLYIQNLYYLKKKNPQHPKIAEYTQYATQMLLAPNLYSTVDYMLSLFAKDHSLYTGYFFLMNSPVTVFISLSYISKLPVDATSNSRIFTERYTVEMALNERTAGSLGKDAYKILKQDLHDTLQSMGGNDRVTTLLEMIKDQLLSYNIVCTDCFSASEVQLLKKVDVLKKKIVSLSNEPTRTKRLKQAYSSIKNNLSNLVRNNTVYKPCQFVLESNLIEMLYLISSSRRKQTYRIQQDFYDFNPIDVSHRDQQLINQLLPTKLQALNQVNATINKTLIINPDLASYMIKKHDMINRVHSNVMNMVNGIVLYVCL